MDPVSRMRSLWRDFSAREFLRQPPGTGPRRWFHGLPTAVLLSWGLLALNFGQMFLRLTSSAGSKVRGTIVEEGFRSAVLQRDIVWFFAAQFLLYALLGIVIWLLGRMTQAAAPAWRIRLGWLILAWWAVLAVAVQVANAALYPASMASTGLEFAGYEIAGSLSVYHFFIVPIVLAAATVAVLALLNSPRRRQLTRAVVWVALAGAVFAIATVLPRLQADTRAHETAGPPHLIVIGVDSVRSDVVSGNGEAWYAPRINAFLKQSSVFPDATTPLARTFPSWVSLLTGRHPAVTGARENLIPFDKLQLGRTLADRVRDRGYRTIYATDDVRFSNIDARYGFDEILGPPMGASDFVLGSLNDVPLANLIANTWLGSVLFPHTYGNRAASVTYEPETFIEWLRRDLRFDEPTFLAVHLTLPHWPYTWASSNFRDYATSERMYLYLESVAATDRQFGQLMELLQEQGALDNAIVVLLSDHGEALGVPSDNLLFSKEAKQIVAPVLVWMWGHGTSVLSPHQYEVMLAMRRFDARQQNSAGRVHADVPASLEDIAPTILELADVPFEPAEFDGLSLAGALATPPSPVGAHFAERFRFTESGISLELLKQGKVDNREMIEEGSFFFRVAPETGRIELKTEQWDYMVTGKERAVIQGDWLLAAIPVGEGKEHRYILVNRKGGLPRRLREVPDPKADPVAASLYQALHKRYPGELGKPAA